ncbi:MAG: cytochrome c peroxidase [Thiolinea sp.]
MKRLIVLLLALLPLSLQAVQFSSQERRLIQEMSGQSMPVPQDASNRVSGQPRAIELGRQLFFDRRLSADGRSACADCHQAERGWADGQILSRLRGQTLPRHTPSLWNVALNRWYFWDGRSDSLWAQATHSLEAPLEMNSNRVYLARLILNDAALRSDFISLFGALPACLETDTLPESGRPVTEPVAENGSAQQQANWQALSGCQQRGVNRLFTDLGKLLAAFEETLLARDSAFDRFAAELAEQGTSQQLDEQQQQGLKLFMGRARCIACHSGPAFSDSEFHSIFFRRQPEPGRYAAIPVLLQDPFNQRGAYSDRDQQLPDKLDYVYRSMELRHKFKTPGLRNLSSSAPYMHDGSMASLREVLDYYAGLAANLDKGRHEETVLNDLQLNQADIEALEAFLLSLNDDSQPEVQP